MAGQHINVRISVEEELGGNVWVPVKWEAVFPESNGEMTRERPLEVTSLCGDPFTTKEAAIEAAKRQARQAIRNMYGPIAEEVITWEVREAKTGRCEMVEG